jgi:sugar lactone lactonase YvrE
MNRSVLMVTWACLLVLAWFPGLAGASSANMGDRFHPFGLAEDQTVGKIEPVAFFYGAMPTGVTVSKKGRIFVNFPQWGDVVTATVAEVKKGKTVPYPDAGVNNCADKAQKDCFVAVQSVVVDPRDRLWVVDTGSIAFGPTTYGGPKLVGIDLKTNQIFKWIIFSQDVVPPASYLNDVRFDLSRGSDGFAFLTDSGGGGPNGIVVVDLGSGQYWRRLANHSSVKPVKGFLPMVEAKPLMLRLPDPANPAPLEVGSDGIAISNDGKKLYYSPLTSHHLYSVSVDALVDQAISDNDVAATVVDYGDKGCASDGLESDSQGYVYLSDIEHNAIHRMLPDKGQAGIETIAHDPRMLWPDTLSLAHDGYLYFTANQIERQPVHTGGPDLRDKPYVIFRIKVNADPVSLK